MARRKTQQKIIAERQQQTARSYGFKLSEIDESYQFLKGQAQKDALVNEYRRLAKRADQRLVRLEQAGKFDKFAYPKAMRDIKHAFGEGQKRFNIQLKKMRNMSILKIETRLNMVLEFLNAPTSTVKGFKKVMSAKAENIEKLKSRYGISESQLISTFERGIIKKYENSFGSSTILKMIAKQKLNKKSFDKWIRDVSGRDIYSPKDLESLIKFMDNQRRKGQIKTEDIIKFVSEK